MSTVCRLSCPTPLCRSSASSSSLLYPSSPILHSPPNSFSRVVSVKNPNCENEFIIAVIVLILTLGQPFVVFLGIGAMGLVTVLGDAIAQYGIEAVLNAFYTERSKKESLETLLAEIDALPLTDDLKLKTKKHLRKQKPSNATKFLHHLAHDFSG